VQELSVGQTVGEYRHIQRIETVGFPMLVGFAAALLVWFHGGGLVRDGDTFWHLRVGEWIVHNRSVPLVDYFSHSFYGEKWVAHEWLSELLLYGAYMVDSWRGVVLLTALAISLCFVYLCVWLQNYLKPRHVFILLLLVLAMVQPHLMVRPHALAQPLFLIWAASLIRRFDFGLPPHFGLLVVMLLWANMHGSFLIGLVLLGALGFESIVSRRDFFFRSALSRQWLLFGVLAVLISLLTPQGIGSYVYVIDLMGEEKLLQHIGEWKSPNFHHLQPLEVWIILLMGLGLLTGYRLNIFRFLIVAGLLHLSLKHIRNVEVLGLITPCLLAASLATFIYPGQAPLTSETTRQRFRQGMIAYSLVVVGLISLFSVSAMPRFMPKEKVSVASAIEFVEDQAFEGNVLNTYVLGGPLIMENIPPFIDGRGDMYGSEFMQNYLNVLKLREVELFHQTIQDYGIGWTFLVTGTPLISLLDLLPEWQRAYEDERVVIHRRVINTGGAVDGF
jgi:hypothetical protein